MAMQVDKNNNLVVSIFSNADHARQAQQGLEAWDKSEPNIKLGACTVVYKTSQGTIAYDHSSAFDWKKEVTANILALVITGSKPLHSVYNMVSGLVSSWTKGLDSQSIQQINTELDQGRGALFVLCDDYEVQPVSTQLTRMGGSTVIGYQIPQNTTSQIEDAVQRDANQHGGPPRI